MDAKERKSIEYSILLLESARQHHGVDYAPHEKVFNKSDIQAAYEVGWDAALRSQWVVPRDRMPQILQKVLILIEYDGAIQIHQYMYCGGEFKFGDSTILAWMPIPSFDDILEANKDVLERLKSDYE